MAFSKYRKETSERSDSSNWVKSALIADGTFEYFSIEGCNENTNNIVTHLLERIRVHSDNSDEPIEVTRQSIVEIETEKILSIKINFAKMFGINLSYVLYCVETERVWLYEFSSVEEIKLVQKFESFESFSKWIESIKGWKSTKKYRETADLPYFDKYLRSVGCAWPTNIDCIISKDGKSVGLLEFQNANKVSVAQHCNNDFLLCKSRLFKTNGAGGYYLYNDDIRRWLSQEILRVQSGLRLFIITWAKNSDDYTLKEVEKIVLPEFPATFKESNAQKFLLYQYSNAKTIENYNEICKHITTMSLLYSEGSMKKNVHYPILSLEDKTFPQIYYKFKQLYTGDRSSIVDNFLKLLEDNQ